MKTEELIERLSAFNEWRRGEETPQPSPEDIGKWIDHACRTLDEQAGILRTLEIAAQSIAKSAQILKQERDEAREERDRYKRMWDSHGNRGGREMSEEPNLDAAKRPNGLRAMADGMIYLAGQTGVETANVWQTADILRAAACEMERLKAERDEARERAAKLAAQLLTEMEGEIENPIETQTKPN